MSDAPVPDARMVRLTRDFWTATPRWSLRRRLPDGRASDVVGHVLVADESGVVLLPEDGPAVRVDRADVVAHRVVPPRAVRPASSPEALERIAARGWPGLALWRLGGWLLRSGGGYSNRANSVLVAGDPGLPIAAALEVVADHYAQLGRPAIMQLPHAIDAPRVGQDDPTADVAAAAVAAGWQPYSQTRVLTADLRRLRPEVAAPGIDAPAATWSDAPDDAWLHGLHGGQASTDEVARAVITSAPAEYLTLRDTGDDPVAIGRLVHTDDWAGLSCIEVAPEQRGRGLGRHITELMLARARTAVTPARFAYLQVEVDNAPALALYNSLGFTDHHDYHYCRLMP
ncbi:GNAT superfamily N-acetyltransferase [Kineosphaera limosa]|uniref:Putative acetyltransferase n=1 Tax=Kineosphaera limosa NBRC 100340 TaxID=1184609 RepID=K6X6T5_9MICO|nr:N-acetyltransferase [Kineosphaera limosa]NYE03202.1 GNAT superfamily N-acetyltransferase [Kineosphaera limosa]GAB94539.1 putative acetyltransferase [Kineosphaera limosa NBRC 100340]